MIHIFDIDQSVIKAVDDKTARELVARLCRAELRAQGLPESAVTWGGDQRAKDGGVDVRVDCPSPLRTPNFLRTARTVIQVKAERFPPSKIQGEMAPKGTLRPAIVELKETGGTYIIGSTQDDVSDVALQKRRDAILQCLSDHQLGTSVQSDFYDSRRIADWVELHPSIATWLRHRIGQPLKGWRPYGPWAHGEDDPEAEYLVDDRVRVFAPSAEEGSCVTDAIAQLRRELERTVSVRIVGLSGVGKTRLVQALFDLRVCPGSLALAPENVIYADLADEPEPQPQTMLESLQDRGSDTIVVIDNCGPETHERLTGIVKRKGSGLKLITVEYDIRDDLPEGTICYRLEGASTEVIKKLLRRRYQRLSDSDADRIAEFSDGNARVAFALASTVQRGGELSRLRSRELFERLFQQKNDPNDELLRCAEAASLLYSFDGSDESPNGEIARLASLAEVTQQTLLWHMAELERRGLLQQRGRWRAVLPHAIANGLASRMIQSAPRDKLYAALIEEGGDRIARSFSRRLGFLHDCPKAVAMASRMLAGGGKLEDLPALSELEQQMFANLAPVDPRGALEAIERAMDNLLSIDSCHRARFSHVARSIAYEPEYFYNAASILVRFTLVESGGYNLEPARSMLRSLFYCHLSGTQASPEQRQKVVRDLISSRDEKERGLGLELIAAGLKASHFTSHYGFEFGARRRDYGWRPRSQADAKDWFRPWIEMVAAIGAQDNLDGRKARTILGEAWRDLWGRAGIDDELVDVSKRLRAIDGWPEGWLGLRRALQWNAESLSPASLAQLRELEKTLAPSDLTSEIRARVLARGTLAYDLDLEEALEAEDSEPLSAYEKHRRTRMKVERLGARAASSPELLERLIPDLCSTGHGSAAYELGQGIGRYHANMAGLLEAVRHHIGGADCGDLSLIWVRGLLSGWKGTDPDAVETFLDEAIDDLVWRNWYVELQVQTDLDARAFNRLLRGLEPGKCPTWQFTYLAGGRATDPLTVSQIAAIVNRLTLRPDRGLFTAIHLLAMVIHCAEERDEQYKYELGEALLEFLGSIDWSLLNSDHERIDHDLGVVLEFALQSAKSESQVAPTLRRLLPTGDTEWLLYGDVRSNALKPFFLHFPRLALDMVCVPGEDGLIVSDAYSERLETAFSVVPKGVLIDWCNEESEERYPFAAGVCQLFEEHSGDKAHLTISDTARELFASAPEQSVILTEFVRRFHPNSWWGSLADILEARLPLLDQLAASGHEVFMSEIAAAKAELQNRIDAEREREKREEKARNCSFE